MSESNHEGIAIIGLAGRFPGADTVEEFWENLVAGKESISFFDDAQLRSSGLDPEKLRLRGHYVPARGLLKHADCFDAAFFAIHPKEAEGMDPQQRVFLEACWTALESAGYPPGHSQGTVGVFAGSTFNTYYLHALLPRPDLIELLGSELVMFGNERDYLATRVAYKLGLKGPALNVSTACSTGLVAIAQAYQSLLMFQCDIAVAGGVSVRVPQESGYFYDEGNIGSPDGHTRTFDAKAAGTVFSNGVAVVVLKRLAEAIDDGDKIYAVIKGAALNNDGSRRVSFGAPGVEGQSEVIATAHAIAGFAPETIGYVEAHGTATPLGDPIEVAALTKAFRLATQKKQFCAIGSAKTNVGHLEAAAGAAGLIKTALALHHRLLPASLHFTSPNPKLDIENSPFFVNDSQQSWRASPGVPRRAGVSSFGTGGTNAHVVLEEAPDVLSSTPSRPWQLLILSAKTPEALDRATESLQLHLKRLATSHDPSMAMRELADVAFTLQVGRTGFPHRRILTCSGAEDGANVVLRDPKHVFSGKQLPKEPRVAFMFTGQGSQYAGMGAELYQNEPVFRAEIDRCAETLEDHLQIDLRSILFPEPGAESKAEQLLTETRFTQPALFTIEYSLAKWWMSLGVRPAAMIGHSVGEYVAACLADVFSLEDALMLVSRRAALVQAQPGGAMLAVRLPEDQLLPLLGSDLALAAINSPNLCVVSGPYAGIDDLHKRLKEKSVAARTLNTSHAFHSSMMNPVLAPFTELLRRVTFRNPQIPFVSNVSARWVASDQVQSPDYWAAHVRDTVRFADGVAQLMDGAYDILLEVGPGQTLGPLARQHPAKPPAQVVLSSLPYQGSEEQRGLLETLGRLWTSGVEVDWQTFYRFEKRQRTVAPTYSFERRRFWPEPPPAERPAPVVASTVTPEAVAVANSDAPAHVETHTGLTASPTIDAANANSRKERLTKSVTKLFEELSGYSLSDVDPSSNLLELGLDSLLLTQASQLLQRKFGVPLTFRQLMEELGSVASIASYLDSRLPAEVPPPAPPAAPAAAEGTSVLEHLLAQQQQLTAELLHLLGRQPAAPSPSVPLIPAAIPATAAHEMKSHGPFKPIDRSPSAGVSPAQRRSLDALIARYTRRLVTSKNIASANRAGLADPRSVAGFKQLWKEMVFPIVTTRSDGSKVWDVDRNEYTDFVMGFGANMFGHRPPFVVDALRQQLEQGFEIGPIQPLAGEVAALIREFTSMDRVAFTNTGSEAVLAATRVSRTVTGRDKIAVFAGAYHGIFDEVLFRPLTVNGETRAATIAPGIPDSAVAEVIVLEYGNPQSLEILRARGSEIAAVLVEPVQSRKLDLQPTEFLRELRRITTETGAALIFDEVVTGFRLEPGGAQSYFGVRADLATYGKVIGGGMPIGIVAGSRRFMDALDGGNWTYGDTSFPEVGVTFFAGTFVRHPLSLAAAKAVLLYLQAQGPALQSNLNQRTAALAVRLNKLSNEFQAPYHFTQFSSLMQLGFSPDQKFAPLLFYLLRERGIHIWENRAFVMTTAHSDADLAKLEHAFKDCLEQMYESEFLPPSSAVPPVQSRSETSSTPDIEEPFPLTEPQKEIWLAAQLSQEAALAYNESLQLDFRGEFSVPCFVQAVRLIGERHPILLAAIDSDGQWQVIKPGTSLAAEYMDLSLDDTPQQRLDALIEREISTPFDLSKGPLARVVVLRLSGLHHVVLWTAHHIVCDGWSGGLIVDELGRIYSALLQEQAIQLDPPATFRDYALASLREQSQTTAAIDYWRTQFPDPPPPLELPADRARPAVRTGRAATTTRHLDPALHSSLKRVAGQNRTTLVVLLLASVKTLLFRLSGQSDVVVGISAAGQALSGMNNLVGHCVNLLPIRTTLAAPSPFTEILATVKKNVVNAFEHHQCTLGALLQHLSVPRLANRPPLVEVIFNLDRDPGTSKFHGLEFNCRRNPKRALHFDVFFNFVEGKNELLLECDFNSDLFEEATINRWLGHLETMLLSIASNPSEPVDRLPILTDPERREITVNWNTGVSYAKEKTLHGWFEQQVERTPGSPAMTFEGAHISYQELNARANRLSHHLKRMGVGPKSLVGLLLDRSPDMIVGILGILKAGAAYLPIDPVYPAERIRFMLRDAAARILVTQSSLVDDLQECAEILCLDASASLDLEPEGNPKIDLDPDSLAYVIYTSGSTGTPKGTLVSHYNVVRLMQATQPWYGFDDKDVWTFFHSHAFDFSVWEMWGALLYGGRLVIVPYLLSRSPRDFRRLLAEERVSVLNQTPSAFKLLMEADLSASGLAELSLRYVIFGGEALDMASLKPWFDRHGDQKPQLVNMYGITETTVHVTYRPLTKSDVNTASVIGKPIPDLQIYILDPHRAPVPIGVTGEIYVGGAGVARGYLNRPELTAQRFLSDPFRDSLDARLYRTGDVARFRGNRDIEYLGRADAQVKVRGFRIELGEIESVLATHPAVSRCLVIARNDSSGDRRLIAYIKPENGVLPSPPEFRAYLKTKLPEYMLPAAIVQVDEFPLTPNGKIDVKNLPLPGASHDSARKPQEITRPGDLLEQSLCRVWSKALRVPSVGLDDNFFELGGHSILAVRILIEIEKQHGTRLPLATFFQAPTVAGLADVLRRTDRVRPWSSLVPIKPSGTRTPLFLMHSHGGNVLEYQALADCLDPDQPVYAFQARGLDGNIVRNQTIEEMAAHYLSELRILQPEGPYVLGGFCFGGVLAFEAAQQLSAAGHTVSGVFMIQTVHPALLRSARDNSVVRHFWERAGKRLDLEKENFRLHRGRYLGERARRFLDIASARTILAWDHLTGRGERPHSSLSLPYILEALGREHDRIFEQYQPRPYPGDVLLIRAAKQLPAIQVDPYLGWKDCVRGRLTLKELPGHQQHMMQHPQVQRLATELTGALGTTVPHPSLALK
jgi:amino acid adenylation domain-containing protein